MLKLENDVLCHCHRCVPRNDNGTNLSVVFRNCQLIHKWLRRRHTFFGFALFSHVALSESSFLGSFSECARVGSSFRLSMAFPHFTIRKKHIRPEKRGQRGCLTQKLSCKTSLWKNPSRQAPLSHSCATTLSHQCTPNIFLRFKHFSHLSYNHSVVQDMRGAWEGRIYMGSALMQILAMTKSTCLLWVMRILQEFEEISYGRRSASRLSMCKTRFVHEQHQR